MSGEPHALATVVRVDPPVSARVGDKAVVTPDGVLTGWIGGACSEPIVIREALAALAERRPRLVRIAPGDTEAAPAGAGVVSAASTCPSGGGLDVFIEPVGVARRIAVLGETPVARILAQLAATVGYDVTSLGDGELATLGPHSAGPDDAVVVATMGHYDQEALAAALRTRAGYVAMVGSRKRAATIFDALRAQGVEDAGLARVHSPAGIDLGPSSQAEIAVAILAEAIAERHRAEAATATPAPEVAVDPVCGMRVAVAGARFTARHGEREYVFCGEHCRNAFQRDPSAYLSGLPEA